MSKAEGTSYPIVLIHGMGVRDRKHINSWGRIPKKLSKEGFLVYQGGQDANGNTEDNAKAIKARVLDVLAATGAGKVNIIAHSKGGLDVRYMITHLGMGDMVATLTTVATPHHGSKTMDTLLKIPKCLLRFGCFAADTFMRICGDKQPKTYEVIKMFSTESSKAFNESTPDDSRVLYQSYGFYMKHWYSDIIMCLPYFIVYLIEGENDGLVTPSSSEWGSYKGKYCGNSRRGVSHCDEVDMRRYRLSSKSGGQISDITLFYLNIAKELKLMGY